MSVADLKPVCPAAAAVSGPAIVCRVMADERERTDEVSTGEFIGELITLEKDPGSVTGFCCGRGLPVVANDPEGSHAHHTSCPVWRAEKERIWERKLKVAEPQRVEKGNVPGVTVGTGSGDLGDLA